MSNDNKANASENSFDYKLSKFHTRSLKTCRSYVPSPSISVPASKMQIFLIIIIRVFIKNPL